MRRVLVTGANGFLGSRLVTRLRDTEVEVFALAHQNRNIIDRILSPSSVITYDGTEACVKNLLGELRPDTVFHLATVMGSDVDRVLQTNIILGTQILHGLQELGTVCAFINAGSFWQFATGHQHWERELYAAAKRAFQNIITLHRRSNTVRALTLILYETYGPHDTRGKLWQQLVESRAGECLSLTNGYQLIDLVYVDDVVQAFLTAAKLLHEGTELQERYAVDSGARASLREVTERFLRVLGKNVEITWGAIQHSGAIMTPWTGPRLPDWSPEISLEAGVRRILETVTRKVEI